MTTTEHIVALIDPSDDHDTTLDVTRGVVERGGEATVVVLVTRHVRSSIAAYAHGARLRPGDAEEHALGRFVHRAADRAGGGVHATVVHNPARHLDLTPYLRPETTVIAVPERLMTAHRLRRLASRTGLPVVVAPRRAA